VANGEAARSDSGYPVETLIRLPLQVPAARGVQGRRSPVRFECPLRG